jgi:hypothetical protein
VSNLEPFKPYLKERLKAGVWNAQVLMRELRERNYSGGYATQVSSRRRFPKLPTLTVSGHEKTYFPGHLPAVS